MASFGTISIILIVSFLFISITPLSTAKVIDAEIKHLCSKTGNLAECYKFLISDPRTRNVDARCLTEVSVDLAYNKAKKIHSDLNSFVKTSSDTHMKNIYKLCSKNYNDAIRDLEIVKNNLHLGAQKNVDVQVKDASEEIKNSEKVFNSATKNDHAHFKKKNQDFEFLLSIAKVASDNLNKK